MLSGRHAAASQPRPALFVGRTRERALLADVVASARDGGAAVVVRGELGVGKTALLEQVAGPATRTVWVHGVEEEAVLPYAALAELMRPLRRYVEQLPVVQRDAVEVALALRPGAPVSTFAVGTGVLAALALAAASDPLVIVVDDHQWLDPSSGTVLSFVARRLVAEHVVLLFAVRDGRGTPNDDVPGLPVLRLAGMPAPDCTALAAGRGLDVPPEVLADAVEETGGNPLALIHVLDGRHHPGRGSAQRAWAAAVAGLPAPARVALFVVAAAWRGAGAVVLEKVLAELGLGLDDLEAAERAGLISTDLAGAVARPTLSHPLLRPVVVEVTPPATRIAAARALARHAEPDQHAWYLAAAATGPDAAAATALAAVAQRAQDRAAPLEAARAWERAAALTPPPAPEAAGDLRADRLLAAATAALLAGSAGAAAGLCDDALVGCRDPLLAADAELVRGRAQTVLGRLPHAAAGLVRAAAAALPRDPARSARLFAEAAVPLAMDHRLPEMLATALRGETADPAGSPSLPGTAMMAAALALRGDCGRARGRSALGVLLSGQADATEDLPFLAVLAEVRMWLEDFDTARRLLGSVLPRARSAGATPALVRALGVRGEVERWLGRWDEAYADATEALRRADELGLAMSIGPALVALARIDAARGDAARCEERLDRAHREAAAHGIGCLAVTVSAVHGFLALGVGEFPAAAEHLEAASSAAARGGLDGPNVVPFAADLVEAHAHAGDLDRARHALRRLEERAVATGLAHPAAVAARCGGLLADDPEFALACFDRAAALHSRCPAPFERARTLLCRAEALRRMRRPAAARPDLVAALAVFGELRARPWAARAQRELAATGRDGATHPGRRPEHLTPQELQIARSVADGLTNSETATALLLSLRTVEAHLTRVYRKLGIRSRAELAASLAPAPASSA